MNSDWETASVENFAEWLADNDKVCFTVEDLQTLWANTCKPIHEIRRFLENKGFKLTEREKLKVTRGFKSNDHNRWDGNPCGGGSGWEQISGFAGQKG